MYNFIKTYFFISSLFFTLPVQAIETLRFCQGPMPPYVLPTDDSELATGIWPSVLFKVFEDNKNVRIKSFILPWKRCQKEVLKGNYDGFYMVTYSEQRNDNYILLPSIHTLRIPYYYSTKKHPKGFNWDSYDDLENKIIGLQRGYNYYQNFHKAWQENKFSALYGADIQTNLLMLSKGRIDLAWDSQRVVSYYLKRLKLTSEIKQASGKHTIYESPQHIGLSKTGKAAKYESLIIEKLKIMKVSGELDRIINLDYSYKIASE